MSILKKVLAVLLSISVVFSLFGTTPIVFATFPTLDNCESTSGWATGAGNALSVDDTDKKQGSYSLKAMGSNLIWFQKAFLTPLNTQVSEDNGVLNFWFYVSDVTKLSGTNQIEISSSGTCDSNEYGWSFPTNLVNGWNYLSLEVRNAVKTGNPNLSAINWFRVYYNATASITVKVDEIKFTVIPTSSVGNEIDDANNMTGWASGSGNVLSLDTDDKKEGTASLKCVGGNLIRFQKSFTTPIYSGVNESTGIISFWYYISDVTKLSGTNQIEISSSGTCDINEYGWSFPTNLVNGWNAIQLRISDAVKIGSPDLSKINWFRVYYNCTSSITTKIDDVQFSLPAVPSPSPTGDCLQLTVKNNNTHGTKYYYNKFSSASYTFQAGDYIEYDAYLFNDTDGAGGIDIINTDSSCFRDSSGWYDQNLLGGHPATKISDYARKKWYHRKLAVPNSMIGKTSAYWMVAGEADYMCGEYTTLYDNITVTDAASNVKATIFKVSADANLNTVYLSNNASATMSITGVNGILPSPLATPNPRIITPTYPQSDLIVADFIVTDPPYNADNTGVNDATAAIQNAIDDCAKAGGGTVWMPLGKYKVTGTIAVKAFVTLRGDWRDPDTSGSNYGTVILANVSSSSLDYPALFRIGGSAGCRGLTIYYPNQSASNPVAYPYTFEIPGAAWDNDARNYMLQTVQEITLINSYKGISAGFTPNDHGYSGIAEQQNEQHLVENIKGTVLNTGLRMQNESESGVIQNVKFNNSYWANALSEFNPPSRSVIDTYTRANGTAFMFGDLEWERIVGIECSDYLTGFHLVSGPRIQFCGQVYGASILNCNVAVKIDDLDTRWGVSFLRSTLQGNIGSSPYCIKKNVSGGYIKLTDCTLSGTNSGAGIQISSPGTSPASYPWRSNIPKPSNTNFYNVLKSPYNADKTGVNDSTNAIQSALTAAGNAGGGTVYLPAGRYKISTHLSVPANVNLRGASAVPVRDQINISDGTVLCAYEGKGTSAPDTATALVTLNGNNSGVSGLIVWYPEHDPRNGIYTFPYAIRGNGYNNYVINVCFVNAYNGIDFKTNACSNHFIKNISACVFKNGIQIGSSSTEGWIENCLENGTHCTRTGYANWPNENYVFDPVINYTKANLTWIKIDGAANEHMINIFTYGANVLLDITGGASPAIYNSASDGYGMGIQAASGSSATAANFMKYGGTTSSGNVTFFNLQAIGF